MRTHASRTGSCGWSELTSHPTSRRVGVLSTIRPARVSYSSTRSNSTICGARPKRRATRSFLSVWRSVMASPRSIWLLPVARSSTTNARRSPNETPSGRSNGRCGPDPRHLRVATVRCTTRSRSNRLGWAEIGRVGRRSRAGDRCSRNALPGCYVAGLPSRSCAMASTAAGFSSAERSPGSWPR